MINPNNLTTEGISKEISREAREVLEVKQSILNILIDARLDLMTGKYSIAMKRIKNLIDDLDKDIKNELSPDLTVAR